MILTDRARIKEYTESGPWGETTLFELFENTAAKSPGKPALLDPPNKQDVIDGAPRRLTYGELSHAVDNLGRAFKSLGLVKDDVVAFLLPNTIEQVIVMLAAFKHGLVVSPLPLLWREYELNAALPLIAPRVLITATNITGRNHAELMCTMAARHMFVRAVMTFGEGTPDGVISLDGIFAGDFEDVGPASDAHGANDIATVCWTGGDTPAPCPIPRTYNQWIAAGMMQLLESDIEHDTVLLSPYPMTGLISIGAFMVPWLLSGCTLCLHHPFDADAFVRQLDGDAVTVTGLPPAVIDHLKGEGVFDSDGSAAHLKMLNCIWPGPLLPKDAEEHAADLMMPVIDVRGFGEMAYQARRRVAGERPGTLDHGELHYPTSRPSGAVLLQTRVKGGISSNGRSGSLLTGDLLFKSPMMFDGFYPPGGEKPDEPVPIADMQGFANSGLRCGLSGTGAAKIDILRRDSHVIFHGGLSISAVELDKLYSEFDGIADAAAFTFDDPVMGERIMVAVVPNPGATVSFNEFVDYLNDRKVAAYKLPDRLVTVKMIPRDENGGVLRGKMLEHV